MSTGCAISVRRLSKCYREFSGPWSRLGHALVPVVFPSPREIWALRDVGFEVFPGESLGIIGRNGSGKSTLLEIIAGTLTPSSGSVEVNGSVAALLELGSGFNPEFSGRENVILNGLLLGLTRREITARFDEIAAFADIGDVLDRPVKTYSSGMMMRLAFSVQVALEPDILIVDEALSVGDFFFQQKCFGHLRRMRERGTTLLFVSHDMGTVRNLCEKAVCLREGRLEYWGESGAAVRHYLLERSRTEEGQPSSGEVPHLDDAAFAEELEDALWRPEPDEAEGRRLRGVMVLDAEGLPATTFELGAKCQVVAYFRTWPGEEVHVSFTLKNRYDQTVISTGSNVLGLGGCTTGEGGLSAFILDLDLQLEAGEYSFEVALGRPVATNRGERLDGTGWIGPLQVAWDYENQPAPFLGMFGLPVSGRYTHYS